MKMNQWKNGLLALLMMAVAVLFAPQAALAGDGDPGGFAWKDYSLSDMHGMGAVTGDGSAAGVQSVLPFASVNVKGRPLFDLMAAVGGAAVVDDGNGNDAGYSLTAGLGVCTPKGLMCVARSKLFGSGAATLWMIDVGGLYGSAKGMAGP